MWWLGADEKPKSKRKRMDEKMCKCEMIILNSDKESSTLECSVCGWTTELPNEVVELEIGLRGYVECWNEQ